jgi:hypothetical protein
MQTSQLVSFFAQELVKQKNEDAKIAIMFPGKSLFLMAQYFD